MSNPDPDPVNLIDQCCDAFESRFGSDKAVTIEQLLSKVSDSQQAAYLKPLLQIELELRTKAGETPSVDELLQRFPKHAEVVRDVVQNPEIRDSLAHQETIAPQHGLEDDSVPTSPGMRIPKQLGRYRIIRKLGQGAMGSVLLAHDEQLDRQVALKIPRGDLQHNTEVRLRFEREAQAAASLHHPNICPIFDIGEFEGIHFICMGYIEGFPLSRYAIAESGLTEQRIAELVLKMAQALAVAHEAGFIHRDLKPANVMVDLQDEPVILDFGLARRIDRDEDIRVTQTGTTIGSPAYMSPEQVDGDQDKVGPHSDIYSLGVILYELLTGRIPFEGSLASVMGQIMTKEPDKPSDYRKDLTVRLEKLCLKMMAKDADQRQPSMHVVVSELQEYLDRYTRMIRTSSADENSTTTVGRGDQRRKQIEQLISSGDYAQAEKRMVALSRETDDALLTAASWAAAELPKLRKTREEVRAGRQEMYSTAARLMKSHDYRQAMRLLEEYPYDLRTPKMQELLERAESKVNEVERLRKEIKTARKRGDNIALLALLKQLLELKPADRKAKELYEQLTKRAAGPISRVMGKNSPTFVSNMSSGLQWMAVVGLFLSLICYPAYLWSKDYLNGPPLEVADGGGDPIVPPAPTPIPEPPVVNQPVSFPQDAVFVNARPLTELNQSAEINAYPWLSPDGLTIWWTREKNGDNNGIYEATRTSTNASFGSPKLVHSNARIGVVSDDGLEIFASTWVAANKPSVPGSASRTDHGNAFTNSMPIPVLADIQTARCFGLSENGLKLVFQNRPAGDGLFVVSRDSRTSPWASIQSITIDSPKVSSGSKSGWGQLLENDRVLVHTQTIPGRQSQERATVSFSSAGDLSFGSLKSISIDGDTSKNIRAPRYCPATGELFYTQTTGPLNAPGSKAELWVAKSAAVNSVVDKNDTEWTELFNGKDLTGWTSQGADAKWTVEDGAIRGESGSGWLVSATSYDNFELGFEYQLQHDTQSGVLLRVPAGAILEGGKYLEVQLLDNKSSKYTKVAADKKHGSLWGIAAAKPIQDVTVREWHRMKIRALNKQITVFLDDQEALDSDLSAYSGLPARQPGALRQNGRIALQLSEFPIAFRNIRIRELEQNDASTNFPNPTAVIDSLQGQWVAVEEFNAGGANSAAKVAERNKRLSIIGDQFRIVYTNATDRTKILNEERGVLSIKADTNPIEIDLPYTQRNGKTDQYIGIIQIKGDVLKHRFVKRSMKTSDRPTTFEGPVPNGWENVYRRTSATPTKVPSKQAENACLHFTGDRLDCVEVPTVTYNGKHPITIEAWVWPEAGGVVAALCHEYRNKKHIGGGLRVGCMRKNGALMWYANAFNDKKWNPGVLSKPFPDFKKWTHVAMTFEKDTSRLFVDGTFAREERLAQTFVPSKAHLRIGVSPVAGASNFTHIYGFTGKVDEVRISSMIRYQTDFTPQRILPADNATMALYHFDEEKGRVAKDASNNFHKASIHGAKWQNDALP